MKNKKTKNLLTKIISAVLLMSVIFVNIGLSTAHAAPVEMKKDGTCPTGTLPLADIGNQCDSVPPATVCPKNPQQAYAADSTQCSADTSGGSTKPTSSIGRETMESFSTVLLAIEGAINRLMFPILYMIGDLLSNQLLFGAGMEDRLREIWVPVRNIVNILFVVALVALALYNVLGLGKEDGNFSIKSLLPRLIVAIIAVNFSFVGIKVFLDGVNVVTTAIFAIPANAQSLTVISESTPGDQQKIEVYCMKLYGDQSKAGGSQGNKINDGIDMMAFRYTLTKHSDLKVNSLASFKSMIQYLQNNGKEKLATSIETTFNDAKKNLAQCKINPDGSIHLSDNGEKFLSKFNTNNAALALAINMGNILFYDRPDNLAQLANNEYESFTINIIFSLLLFIVYSVSFLALFIVLLARLVVLWLALAFSPVLAAALIIPQIKEKSGDFMKKFTSHAVAPIGIAAAMTVGWIMMNAIKGAAAGSTATMNNIQSSLITGLPLPGLDTIQGLMACLATVAVVWMGVFAAAKDTIANGILEPLKGGLEKAGGWLAKAPVKYAPWIPVEIQDKAHPEKNKTVNMGWEGLKEAKNRIMTDIEHGARQKADAIYKSKNVANIDEIPKTSDDAIGYLNTMLKNNDPMKIERNRKDLGSIAEDRKDIWDKMKKVGEEPSFTSSDGHFVLDNIKNGNWKNGVPDDTTTRTRVERGLKDIRDALAKGSEPSTSKAAKETIAQGIKGSFPGLEADQLKKISEQAAGLSVDTIAAARTTVKGLLKNILGKDPTQPQIDAVIKAKLDTDKQAKLGDKEATAKIDAKLTELATPSASAAPATPSTAAAPAPRQQAQPATPRTPPAAPGPQA